MYRRPWICVVACFWGLGLLQHFVNRAEREKVGYLSIHHRHPRSSIALYHHFHTKDSISKDAFALRPHKYDNMHTLLSALNWTQDDAEMDRRLVAVVSGLDREQPCSTYSLTSILKYFSDRCLTQVHREAGHQFRLVWEGPKVHNGRHRERKTCVNLLSW